MKAWNKEVTVITDDNVEFVKSQTIAVCQIAEAGAMGYLGGVFLVTNSGVIFFTDIDKPWLEDVFPPIKNFECGLMGHGANSPDGYKHEYLGMGNHLLVSDRMYDRFNKLARKREHEHPEKILYNLWLDVALEILTDLAHD